MITKAIVEEIISPYQIRVRMPFYDKIASAPGATATKDLYIASISALPNSRMNYQIGDIVFIGFEDHSVGKPIILGQLCRENSTDSYPAIYAESVTAKVDAHLPYDTLIGDVKSEEIACLRGVNANLQMQINALKEEIKELKKLLNEKVGG